MFHIYIYILICIYTGTHQNKKIDVFTHGHLAKNGICQRRTPFWYARPLNIVPMDCPETSPSNYQ